VPDENSNLNPPARRPDASRRRGRRGGRGRTPRPLPKIVGGEMPQKFSEPLEKGEENFENISAENPPEMIPPESVESVSEIPREREPQLRRPKSFPRRENFRPAEISAINQAIVHATEIVGALQQSLDQMEEILELVELAERQKIADEREIDELRRALHRLQPPRQLQPSRAPRREESSRGYKQPVRRQEEFPTQSGAEEIPENQNPEE
jgi:hypothetical protein